jgi:signal transduction histidine kinase
MEEQFIPTLLQATTHELRTPLTVILSYTELLRKQVYGPLTSEQQRALEKIESSCRVLTSTINQKISEIESAIPTYH